MGKILIGVDVGGPAKGFHAVALQDRTITSKLRSRSADEVAAWVQSRGADVVAIDAPCRWRQPRGPSRTAERQMAGAGISSFSTPTEEKAAEHPFYTWMLAGMKLYAALRPTHPVYDGTPRTSQVCFETFPQAVACALAGEVVSAKEKNWCAAAYSADGASIQLCLPASMKWTLRYAQSQPTPFFAIDSMATATPPEDL